MKVRLMLQRIQEFLFPPPPPPPSGFSEAMPVRSDYRPVHDLLVEHDHEMRTIEEIVATIRRDKPDAGGMSHVAATPDHD